MRLRGLVAALVLVLAGVGMAAPAFAKILKTTRPGEYHELALTLGSGLEFETDGEETEYGFPFLAEYGVTRAITVSVEPSWTVLDRKVGKTLVAAGDLETTATWEFLGERRSRPTLALEGGIKWPTAPAGDLGTGKFEYTLGAIISKEFTRFDLDFNAEYTWIGDPEGVHLRDVFEASLAAEWHLSPTFDLEGEVVSAMGAAGTFSGDLGSMASFANIGGPEQGESETEYTIGFAEHASDRLKLEQGAVIKSGGSFQLVLAWEFDFAEGPWRAATPTCGPPARCRTWPSASPPSPPAPPRRT